METELVKVLATGGPVAILAFAIFLMYRADHRGYSSQLREDRKFMEDRLTKTLADDQETRKENTKVLSELVTLIQRLNGRLQ